MKRIIKLEIKRAKKIYNKKLISLVSISLILMLGFFFIVLKIGGLYQNRFYTFSSDSKEINFLLNKNQKFIEVNKEPGLYVLWGNNLNLIGKGFSGKAATLSSYEYFKNYNYYIYE